jgi:hypothetical protein
MFTDDYVRLSRPAYYINSDIRSLDGADHKVQLYLDASAEHAVNGLDENTFNQSVTWQAWNTSSLNGLQIGNSDQNVLGSKGDRVNIDWGFLHMGVGAASNDASNDASPTSTMYAGSAATAQAAFKAGGALPTAPDTRKPRAVSDDLPTLAVAADLGVVSKTDTSFLVMLGYDDVKSVYYFGSEYKGFWTQTYKDIQDAMGVAHDEYPAMLAKSNSHDSALVAALTAKAGEKYAAVCALAYRQTLAATKLVWNSDKGVMWNFLKEISTNGDMQTMDVIYPGSPMLLYSNPELLKLLLVPVLDYAANGTFINFSNPYSPHQLGTYPIANDTTAAQEPMPLENSGNMFFMMLGIVQQDPTHDTSWFYPKYWPMLTTWADELVRTTEFPANQICTDDFTGKLANNTNLGCKGTIAIEVYAELCRLTKATNDCAKYSKTATKYAETWQKYAYTEESGQKPHYKMSFNNNISFDNKTHIDDSWSLKYNLLWQKLLKLDGPYPYAKVSNTEVAYYISKSNKYGIPMDPRHTYVKTDWLSWAAAMANTDTEFHAIMDPIFKFANESASRVPFTDLYDTNTADAASSGFIARPVMGGLFAKMLE